MATFTRPDDLLYTVEAMGASDTAGPIRSRNGGFLAGAVQIVAGGGTGFNSGTVTVQASVDGTTWFPAKDVTGANMTFTADAYYEFSLAATYLRVSTDGSISDVDVALRLQ